MRVVTSTLTFQHILDVVYISLKKPSMLLYSKHTKYFKKVKIFSTFEPSLRPISDFFTLFRKPFKVIFFVKLSPKCLENALERFKTSWLIQILDEFWLCVQGFVNCAQYLIPGQLLCFLYTLLSPNAMCILVRFQSILWAAGMWNPCVGSTPPLPPWYTIAPP